jgi:hypothetical protein
MTRGANRSGRYRHGPTGSRPHRDAGAGHRPRMARAAALVVIGIVVTACSSPSSTPPITRPAPPPTVSPSTSPTSPTGSTTTSTATADTPVTWLCRPGLADNPCLTSLATTVVTGRGVSRVVQPKAPLHPKIDCFYVYPTVSTQPTPNANLTIDPQETAVAIAQASRFSQVCNVYAPMYRQLTVSAIGGGGGGGGGSASGSGRGGGANLNLAYGDVLAAWKYYLAHYNQGRGVAFIGHSQGSAMLIRLLKSQIDPDPVLRSRMVSAILLGGNVTVPIGKKEGGTFAHLPLCTDVTLPGCVIAYSSYNQTPPANSIFGRVGSLINVLSGERPGPGEETACVNPVAGTGPPATPTTTDGANSTTTKPTRPARRTTTTSTTAAASTSTTAGPTSTGPSGALLPYFPVSSILGTATTTTTTTSTSTATSTSAAAPDATISRVTTPWVTFPKLYQAQCMSQGGATWLMVEDVARPGDKRPVVSDSLGPTWGLHLVDVNIALGNLVTDLQQQAKNYPS